MPDELLYNGVILEFRNCAIEISIVFNEVLPLLDTHILCLPIASGTTLIIHLLMEWRIFVYLPSLQKLICIEDPYKSLDSLVCLFIIHRVASNLNPHPMELLFKPLHLNVFDYSQGLLFKYLSFQILYEINELFPKYIILRNIMFESLDVKSLCRWRLIPILFGLTFFHLIQNVNINAVTVIDKSYYKIIGKP